MDQPILGNDFYSGNETPPFRVLREQYNVQLYIRKMSMGGGEDWPRIEEDLAGIRDASGVLVGYHWCDPIRAAAYQGDIFLRAIEKYRPQAIAFDIEQFWANWKEYDEYARGKRSWEKLTKLSAQKIFDNAAYTVDWVRQRCDLPYLLYTGRWFTAQHCPALGPWMGDQPAWLASYADYYFRWPVGTVSRGVYPISVVAPDLPAYAETLDPAEQMAVPTGCRNPVLWQFSSRILLPECKQNYDWNLWLLGELAFREFFRLPASTPVEPPVEEPIPAPAGTHWTKASMEQKDGVLLELARRGNLVDAEDRLVV